MASASFPWIVYALHRLTCGHHRLREGVITIVPP